MAIIKGNFIWIKNKDGDLVLANIIKKKQDNYLVKYPQIIKRIPDPKNNNEKKGD